ncbi:hypothetical protein [Sphingobium yanoikuyae]|nr:hypothetical protein [Sphingobium yanoikuyae]
MDEDGIGKMIALLDQLKVVALELSRYGLKVTVTEKGCAICPMQRR